MANEKQNGLKPGGEGQPVEPAGAVIQSGSPAFQSPFSLPRNSLNNRFVYAVISQRARGLSIGVNLNPDKHCNFDCVYCEVNRDTPGKDRKVDLKVMGEELEALLALAQEGRMRELPGFRNMPAELLELKEVALSGNGEPTLCPDFAEVMREIFYIRSTGRFRFFKIVLITNTTGLDLPDVKKGLKLLSPQDEIWVKLDAGTQEYMNRTNRGDLPLWRVLDNILCIAKQRPVVVQSLFPLVNGEQPPVDEIEQYAARLKELKNAGAQISMVQVYSAHRPPHRPDCEHLPLKSLSQIARRVRDVAGLRAEVF
jgi:wyosine [tRNA(Phe)-imidazoG37] synthetase (radical SAM superfamily)